MMQERQRVNIGIVGSGFIAETRARSYASVTGYDVRLVAVASRGQDRARAYAQRFGVPDVLDSFEALLDRKDVDVVDLCVPNFLHRPMTEQAAAAGKHVICSKPLTAFDGQGMPEDTDVAAIPRAQMLKIAVENAEAMVAATERAGVRLMYAENWVYAPPIQKAARLIEASGGTTLEMRAGECHSGSHSPYSTH